MFVRAVDWALFDRIFSASAGWKTVHTRQRALSTAIRRQLGRGNTGTYAPTHITVSEVMCFFVVVMHGRSCGALWPSSLLASPLLLAVPRAALGATQHRRYGGLDQHGSVVLLRPSPLWQWAQRLQALLNEWRPCLHIQAPGHLEAQLRPTCSPPAQNRYVQCAHFHLRTFSLAHMRACVRAFACVRACVHACVHEEL